MDNMVTFQHVLSWIGFIIGSIIIPILLVIFVKKQGSSVDNFIELIKDKINDEEEHRKESFDSLKNDFNSFKKEFKQEVKSINDKFDKEIPFNSTLLGKQRPITLGECAEIHSNCWKTLNSELSGIKKVLLLIQKRLLLEGKIKFGDTEDGDILIS